jgi:hypothetical protein
VHVQHHLPVHCSLQRLLSSAAVSAPPAQQQPILLATFSVSLFQRYRAARGRNDGTMFVLVWHHAHSPWHGPESLQTELKDRAVLLLLCCLPCHRSRMCGPNAIPNNMTALSQHPWHMCGLSAQVSCPACQLD